MAKKKKPKHLNLKVPDETKINAVAQTPAKPDRLGRLVDESMPPEQQEGTAQENPAPETETEQSAAEQGRAEENANVVQLPRTKRERNALLRKNPRIAAIRRKKMRRRFIPLIFLGVFMLLALIYLSGIYLPFWTSAKEVFTDMRLSSKSGDGFPMEFILPDYIESQSMGNSGFAALGAKDLAVVGKNGTELLRVQHNYTSPAITAGNKRVCVYARGGTELQIYSRDGLMEKINMDEEIIFAQISPRGYLAVVTSSRYQATLYVYNPVIGDTDWIMKWPLPITEQLPFKLSFASDDKTFALASISAQEGALSSTINIAETNKDKIKASIQTHDALVLHMEFITQNRLLVLYDSFAAVYSAANGELLHSYSYDMRSLAGFDSNDGFTALIFSSSAQEALSLILLDEELVPTAEIYASSTLAARVLSCEKGVLLMCDNEIFAYDHSGALLEKRLYQERPIDFVYSNGAYAIMQNECQKLTDMFDNEPQGAPQPPQVSSASPPQINPDDNAGQSDDGAGGEDNEDGSTNDSSISTELDDFGAEPGE